MKATLLVSILFLILSVACTTPKPLSGSYGRGDLEFRFTSNPNEYEYYSWGHWGIREYSKGKWELNGKKLTLYGFKDSTLKFLDVESYIQDDSSGSTRISVGIAPVRRDEFIRTVVVINGSKVYQITRDTSFVPGFRVATIQVKAYLSYSGLLPNPQTIDTLSSTILYFSNEGSENKNINLKFAVRPEDFYRVVMRKNTGEIKNNRVLYVNEKAYIKLKGPMR